MGPQIIVPTVQHSGTHYLLNVIRKPVGKLCLSGKVKDRYVIHGHLDKRTEKLLELSKGRRTVIPLRHPALIAVSWKKRGPARWRTPTFLDQWKRMDEFDAFFFPLEEKPYKALEEYLRLDVVRVDKRVNSIGDYPERNDLQTARDFLKDDWALVEQALNTKIGSQYYDNPLCRV